VPGTTWTPRNAGGGAVLTMAGLARWASRGPGELERVGPSGSAQTERIGFVIIFFEFIFNAKTIPEKSRNYLKARKILRKSQKFQENS
jgi:hypothetical protein